MSPYVRSFLFSTLLACAATRGHAQSTLDSACAASQHRQFDFWIGTWAVSDTAGRQLGTNEITRVAGGCGLREHWRGGQGGEGMSLNTWQPALGKWTQFWVGPGAVLHLTGGLDTLGSMVLAGDRATPQGTVLDRITWEPLDSATVRQRWDVSPDGGTSWRTIFLGIYRRRESP